MIKDFKEMVDRGNEYAGTQIIVDEWMNEVLKEKGIQFAADEILLEGVPFDEIMNLAWDKAMKLAVNVLESYSVLETK